MAASGNQGASQISFPAAYDDVIAVAAMDKSGKLANFSNVGEGIDFVAPGVDVYSTWPGAQYSLESGTSMAAPFISGVVALMLSYHRHPGEHRTPINGYKDAVEHMRKLQPGNMVSSTPSGNGIAIVDFSGFTEGELCDVAEPQQPIACVASEPKILSSWGWRDRMMASLSKVGIWVQRGGM